MKRLLILIVLIMGMSIMAEAQMYKFRTSAFAISEFKVHSQTWSDYSTWTSANVLIVIDATNERILIYSATTQKYDIIDLLTDTKNGDNQTMSWQCVDADSVKCIIRIVIRGDYPQMYIDYSNVSWVYNLKNL